MIIVTVMTVVTVVRVVIVVIVVTVVTVVTEVTVVTVVTVVIVVTKKPFFTRKLTLKNSKTVLVIKLKNSNCDETQKLKL